MARIFRILKHSCNCCGNTSGYDKESLKASTWNINGGDVVLCCPCEDDLLVKLAKGRGIIIKLGDGGELESVRRSDKIDILKETIQVPIYYALPFKDSKKVLVDEDSIREEFEYKLAAAIKENNRRKKKQNR